MAEKYNQPTIFDRLRRSRTAKTALLLAGLAVAGCSVSSSPASSPAKGGKATPVAVGKKTPGTTDPTTASSGPTEPATSAASRADWCKAASTLVESAFEDPNALSECVVMPASATPGDVLIKWTLNYAGVTGFLVEASVLNTPFDQMTSGAKPTTTTSGEKVVVVPNSTQMYVKIPGNTSETGEMEVLSGEGGAIPIAVQNNMMDAAGVFNVFGSASNASLYPAGSQ